MSPSMGASPNEPVRISIIGAGQRGLAYARGINNLPPGKAKIDAIVDPIQSKRAHLGAMYIWGPESRAPRAFEEDDDWQSWIENQVKLRSSNKANGHIDTAEETNLCRPSDAVMICVLDEMHIQVLRALAEASLVGAKARKRGWQELHVLCEKPLATTLKDVIDIGRFFSGGTTPGAIFSVCHVLRYSPHNMLLRDLVLEQKVIGDILSVEHTEPVGWWHFSHSYVRGNWRNSSNTAPSLLTKSCHDIDFLLWLMCTPPNSALASQPPHIPSVVCSVGATNFFRKSRKPRGAGDATNCMACPIERDCMYSAVKIYNDHHLSRGNTEWPVNIVIPDLEETYQKQGPKAAERRLLDALSEDYDADSDLEKRLKRPWFGRCVWECDNDVCDDQVVTVQWKEDPLPNDGGIEGRGSKTATFHMIAQTERQCERRGRIYGTKGEIEYDSTSITIYDFDTKQCIKHHPHQPGRGHGGGDDGLVRQFVGAVNEVKNNGKDVARAQREYLGCTLEEAVRSHAMVWAAEVARMERKVVDWNDWWNRVSTL